jgi:hypothetical protein
MPSQIPKAITILGLIEEAGEKCRSRLNKGKGGGGEKKNAFGLTFGFG